MVTDPQLSPVSALPERPESKLHDDFNDHDGEGHKESPADEAAPKVG